MQKVHISLSDEIIDKIAEECKITGDSRSSFCRRAVLAYIDSLQAMRMMPEMLAKVPGMLEQMQKIQEENKNAQLSNQLHLADLIKS